MAKQQVVVSVLAETRQFKREMAALGDASGLTRLGHGIAALGEKLKQAAKWAGTAASAMGAAGVKAASDLEQSSGTVDDVFKQNAKSVHGYAASAAKDLGLSRNEYYELATVIGTQLKNGGTSFDELAGKSRDLISLGADLSAGFGGSTTEAVQAISSALKGERDPIERYGVSLKQSAIEARAAELGFKKVGGALSNEATQAATLSLIMEQTRDFHGKFGREGDTLAHKVQVLKATFTDLSARLGQTLLPVVSKVVGWVGEKAGPAFDKLDGWIQGSLVPGVKRAATTFRNDWWPAIKDIAVSLKGLLVPAAGGMLSIVAQLLPYALKIAAWAASHRQVIARLAGAIGGAVLAYKTLKTAQAGIAAARTGISLVTAAVGKAKAAYVLWTVATNGMTFAQKALMVITAANPITLLVTAIAALVGYFVVAKGGFDGFKDAVVGAWNTIWGAIKDFFGWLKDVFVASVKWLIDTIVGYFTWLKDMAVALWTGLYKGIVAVVKWIVDGVVGYFTWLKDMAVALWTGLYKGVVAVVGWLWDNTVGRIIAIVRTVAEWFGKLPGWVWDAMKAFAQWVAEGVANVAEWFGKLAGWVWDAMKSFAQWVAEGVANVARWFASLPGKIWDGIKNIASTLWNTAVEWGKNIVNGIGDIGREFVEIGKDAVRGFWNGIVALAKWLWQKIKDFFGGIVDGIKGLFGISSPSRVFAELGRYTVQGFAQGMVGQYDAVEKAAAGLYGLLTEPDWQGALGSLTVPLPAAAGAHGAAGVRAPVINVTVNTLNPTADVGAAIASALQQYKSQVGRSW